jgi:hypothetical protein
VSKAEGTQTNTELQPNQQNDVQDISKRNGIQRNKRNLEKAIHMRRRLYGSLEEANRTGGLRN